MSPVERGSSVATNSDSGRGSASPRQRLLFGWGYEDEAIEIAQFPSRGRVLVVAGTGEVAAALAATGCDVVAVDANEIQLSYARRRVSGAPFELGSAERIMDVGRGLIRTSSRAWTRPKLRAFLSEQNPAKAAEHWRRTLNSRGFRSILKATLRPASALTAVVQRDFGTAIQAGFADVVIDRLRARIGLVPPATNRFAWRLLLGEELPKWTFPERLRGTIDWRAADMLTTLRDAPAASFDGISLSNLGDGADPRRVDALWDAALRAVVPGGSVLLRSFRSAGDPQSTALAAKDRALVWGSIRVVRGE